MGLTTELFAHFAHVTVVIVGFSMAAVLHTALFMMRSAKGVDDLRQWPRVIARLEPLLPVDALLILLTGSWLIQLNGDEFSWEDGWISASFIGLVLAELAGGALAPRSKKLRRAIRDAEPGPISPELRRRITDPWLWCIAHINTATFLGIVFLMVVKPSGAASAGLLLGIAALGALTAVPFVRRHTIDVEGPHAQQEASVPSQHRSA